MSTNMVKYTANAHLNNKTSQYCIKFVYSDHENRLQEHCSRLMNSRIGIPGFLARYV